MPKKNSKTKKAPKNEPKNSEEEVKEENEEREVARDYKSEIKQIESEYRLAFTYMSPKFDEWAIRLKLYNNQKRDKQAVGDPLLFTIHQTVLASLYSDRLGVEFAGREEGDEGVAEDLNALAVYDYDQMSKDELDYDWDWDSSFFGRGLLLNMEFDRETKTPIPEVIDIMTWLRDPRAKSVNGDKRGRGKMRFGGREISLSKIEMKEADVYFNYENLTADTADPHSLLDTGAQARAEAQGYNDPNKFEKLTGDNEEYRLLEWFTHRKGKKVIITLAENRKRVIRYTELKGKLWPINDRPIYPISHDWDGVSIPDLVEDKQRARAVVQNLALKGIKVGLNPTYLYNTNKIKNRAGLKVDFNKHIPIDGDPSGAVENIQRQTVKQEANWILDILDGGAQKATATPDIQQGATSDSKRTATELNLQTEKVDVRYSLSAKIWGWSEKRFWQQWYQLYKQYFKADIDEKIIRIVGALGVKWRPLTKENLTGNQDPDIKIESKIISDALKLNDLQKYRLFIKDVLAIDPQNSNTRFALRKIGRLSGFTKEEIEQVLPPSIDELNADTENDTLNENDIVKVQIYDDDFVHIEIHNKSADTQAKFAHMEAHKKAMMLKRVNPALDLANNRPDNPEGTEDVKAVGVDLRAEGTPLSQGGRRELPQRVLG